MIKYITKILGIDHIPQWLLYHLMFLSLFLGALQAFLSIGAMSEFISSGMIAYYPESIAFSGLFGILLFGFYKFVNKNFSYRKTILFLYIIILFTIFLALFLPVVITELARPILLFIIFVPINLISEQFINDINNKLPFLKSRPNLRRYSETLYLTGSMAAALIIVIFSGLGFKLYIFVPILFLLVITAFESDFILKRLETKKDDEVKTIDSVISTFSDTPLKLNVLIIMGFIFLSILNLIFIDYIFIDKISKTPEISEHLVTFLGIFWIALIFVTLLFKLFVYQNLIKTFRLNNAIYLSPLLLFVFILTLNAGYYYIEHYGVFFINIIFLILFIRFFAYVLRESFELYSIRMILAALSLFSEKTIAIIVSNLFTLWGYLFSGLVLLLIMSVDLFKIKNLLFINLSFIACWIVIAVLLVKKYRSIIQKTINKLLEYRNNMTSSNLSLKERVMISTNLSGLKYLLNFQRYYQPFDFEKNIKEVPTNVQEKLKISGSIINPSEYATNLHEPSKFESGNNSPMNFYDSDVSLKLTDIENLASSTRIKDRIRAVKMIENSHNFKYSGIFKMLIRDSDEEVMRNAIMACVTYYNAEILEEIIKYTNLEEYSTLVAEVLIKIGDDSIPSLSSFFFKTETNQKAQSQIIKIIGKIASQKALDFLTDKLNYPNKLIIKETTDALIGIANKPSLRNAPYLNTAILKIIHVLAWLLAKEVSLENISKNEPIKRAIEDEYKVTFNLLFNLLQLKYQNGIIDFISQHIQEGQTNEQKELFVELLTPLLDEDIKLRLLPLLHNNQINEKIQQLSHFYPVNKTDALTAIKDLLNADYEYISIWTRACALKLYIETEDDLEKEEIIAQVFNPELMIAELAFFSIYKKKPEALEFITDRIPAKLKNRVTSILNKGPLYEYSLIFNKVLNLQKISYFEKLTGHSLIPFAEILNEVYLAKNENTYLKCSDEEVLPVFFEPYGEIALFDAQKRKIRLNQNYLYGLGLYAGGVTIQAFADSILYIAQPEQIGYLVIHYEELSAALFKYIQNSNFY